MLRWPLIVSLFLVVAWGVLLATDAATPATTWLVFVAAVFAIVASLMSPTVPTLPRAGSPRAGPHPPFPPRAVRPGERPRRDRDRLRLVR